MAQITVSFTFCDQEFPELKAWLDSLQNRRRSMAIREVLHAHLQQRRSQDDGMLLGAIYRKVVAMEQKLESGIVIGATTSDNLDKEIEVPDDIAINIDSLGL